MYLLIYHIESILLTAKEDKKFPWKCEHNFGLVPNRLPRRTLEESTQKGRGTAVADWIAATSYRS